jgi:cerevisin
MFKRKKNAYGIASHEVQANNIMKSQQHFSEGDEIHNYVSNGYVASLNPSTVERLKADENVQVVEKDKMMRIADFNLSDYHKKEEITLNEFIMANFNLSNDKIFDDGLFGDKNMFSDDKILIKRQYDAPWGLSRVTGLEFLKKHMFLYPSNSGENVEVYVIDTGIEVNHPEFQGRARWGANLVEGSEDRDENGHGTHCAGVIGSKSYGLAKKANITAVKVLDKNGAGLISRIISGIDFVIEEHEERLGLLYDIAKSKFINEKLNITTGVSEKIDQFIQKSDLFPKTVVNMSVGGGKSAALNFALDYATSLGIHFSVAAGNDNQNACEYSPGSSNNSITTGASTQKDITADFSNFGKCVDIYAPGVEILSTWNDKGTKFASGTSMATPHTTGTMAMYLSTSSYTPEELKNQILKDSQKSIKDSRESSFISNIWPINKIFGSNKLPLLSIQNLLYKIENEQLN